MTATEHVTFTHHEAEDVPALLDELGEVYADAYGVEPSGEKTDAFRDRATGALGAKNYELVTARTNDGQLIGFGFGYSLRPERGWWDGLTPEPPAGFSVETGTRTAVLAEIEVRQSWQGQGIGRALHDAFLARRPEERATLACNPVATHTHAIYDRWGWTNVGRVPGKPGAYFREYVHFVLELPAPGERR